MSKAIPLKYAVQIRTYQSKLCGNEELSGIGEIYEETVFETKDKSEAFQYFEDLKSKDHEIQKEIRYSCSNIKPFFEARILKYTSTEPLTSKSTPKEIELVGWTWILQRYIDISYRCKITINGKNYWTKKIYHVPPILINSVDCPSYINSRAAKAFACDVLRSFLPADGFKLEKITVTREIDTL